MSVSFRLDRLEGCLASLEDVTALAFKEHQERLQRLEERWSDTLNEVADLNHEVAALKDEVAALKEQVTAAENALALYQVKLSQAKASLKFVGLLGDRLLLVERKLNLGDQRQGELSGLLKTLLERLEAREVTK
jgi:predicted  nucleic acid-binding Zn-ribbon protein